MFSSVPNSSHGGLRERRRSVVLLWIGLLIGTFFGLPTASSQATSREKNLLPARPFWRTAPSRLPGTTPKNSFALMEVLLPVSRNDAPDTRLGTFTWWGVVRVDGCPGEEDPIWLALAKNLDDLTYRGNIVVLHGDLSRLSEAAGEGGVSELIKNLQVEAFDVGEGGNVPLSRVGTDLENLSLQVAYPLPIVVVDGPYLALVVESSRWTIQAEGPLFLENSPEAKLCRDIVALVQALRGNAPPSRDASAAASQ